MKQYETIFIITPLLTDKQMKETAEKFKNFLIDNGSEIVHEENWGLKQLAYPIQKKSTGFYHLIEFKGDPSIISKLEVEYRRDERIIRYLTTALDKHAIAFNERRRRGELKSQRKQEVVS